MKNKTLAILIALSLTSFVSCSQSNKDNANKNTKKVEAPKNANNTVKAEPHRYGGWYCPDNLNGFPPVNVSDWESVPVVNGRMATKEETQNGTSLIFVDLEKYPNAKPLDMQMPRLASFYNQSSRRKEIIIVIQALNIDNDSIVGFRYLNGGNGSARLNEVRFLSNNEIEMIPKSQFVSQSIIIKADKDAIWNVLTNPENSATLQKVFDENNELKKDWRKASNVNFHYGDSGKLTASYADMLYGNFYIQNDYEHYNQKFLIIENELLNGTELKIVCGPYGDDFEAQKNILNKWAKKVKELSESKG